MIMLMIMIMMMTKNNENSPVPFLHIPLMFHAAEPTLSDT